MSGWPFSGSKHVKVDKQLDSSVFTVAPDESGPPVLSLVNLKKDLIVHKAEVKLATVKRPFWDEAYFAPASAPPPPR